MTEANDPLPTTTEPQPGGASPGVGFGVALIVIGAAIIAARLLPGVNVWQLWPLIIVSVGIKTMLTRGRESKSGLKRVLEGLTTVIVGLILLGNTTGYLSWGVWLSVLSLWPLLLIAAGLEIIGKGMRSPILQGMSSLVIIGGLLFGALVLPSASFNLGLGIIGPRAEPFTFTEKADSQIVRGAVSLVGAVGDMELEAGPDLITAKGATPFGEPEFDVTKHDDRVEIQITTGDHGVWTAHRGQPRLEVRLSEDIAWNLSIKSGVSRLDADLSELDVREFAVAAGVSDSEIRLGVPTRAARIVPVNIGSGVSTVRVLVPEGVPYKVTAAAGLGNVDIGDRSGPTIGGRTYSTEDFGRGRTGYDIDIGSGVFNVVVDTYE